MAPGNGWLPAAFVDPRLKTLEGGGLSHLIIRSEQHVLLIKHGIGGWQIRKIYPSPEQDAYTIYIIYTFIY